jgi:hypothetical protein
MADDKELGEHALKTAAGRALTRHLVHVGQEMTESCGFDEHGSSRPITKLEALARLMWKLAFGYEEEIRKIDSKTGRPTLLKRVVPPDKAMIALIYDRMEGRVTNQEEEGRKKPPLSSRVREQTRRRINKLTESKDG